MNAVINNLIEAGKYLDSRFSSAYSKSSFDSFLKEIKFSYLIPSIHITGTNGKGSTANFIKNIYQHHGYKVGLFVSPSLNSFHEMISISSQLITEKYVVSFFSKFKNAFERFNLTAFEIETFLAFSYLQDLNVDLAVIEVGMGGRIDATNIFTPILSIITNVGLEHTFYLGKTIGEIAFHKAGIIKPKIPVLVGDLLPEALEVIKKTANEFQSSLFIVDKPKNVKRTNTQVFDYQSLKQINLSMKAPYQLKNASMAIQAVEILKESFPINEKDIRNGLFSTSMEARFEVVGHLPEIIIDGGHNPAAIKELIEAMKDYQGYDIDVLFAAFKDKDIISMLKDLSTISKTITLTTFDHLRARKKSDYLDWKFPFEEDFSKAIGHLREKATPRSVILITGSLAFVGLVRKLLAQGGINK